MQVAGGRSIGAPAPRVGVADWSGPLLAAAFLLGIAARVVVGWGMPLWFDETFTGVIAGQPHAAGLLRWCLNELTGPAYYMPMWAWAQVFGVGDASLRIPSLIASVAAPILLWRRGHPDRLVRCLWAGIVLLWLPALPFATEARPYPQLFLLACCQAIAFLHMMRGGRAGWILGWSAATATLGLTHYYSLLVGGLQGLALLAMHRRRLLAAWWALLPFALLGGWMTVHLPFVLSLMHGQSASYSAMPVSGLAVLPGLLFGVPMHGTMILGTIAASLLLAWRRGAAVRLHATPEAMLIASGIGAVVMLLALALLRPGFAPRYAIPAMPALLFGVAWWGRTTLPRDAKPIAIVLALMALAMAGVVKSAVAERGRDDRYFFTLQRASTWLLDRPPHRLVFLWTDGIGRISSNRNVSEVAGFFFRRAGHPVAVTVVKTASGEDPSVAARRAAGEDTGAAILWVSNEVGGPWGPPPRIAAQDPRFTCHDFGIAGRITVTACRR